MAHEARDLPCLALSGSGVPRGHRQRLETFLLVTAEVGGSYWHLGGGGKCAAGHLQCTGRVPQQNMIRPQMSVVPTLRNDAFQKKKYLFQLENGLVWGRWAVLLLEWGCRRWGRLGWEKMSQACWP